MRNGWRVLKMGFRAATWRTTPNPPVVGFGGLIVWCIVSLFVGLVHQIGYAFTWEHFSFYGLNALVAQVVLATILAAVVICPEQRTSVLSALAGLGVAAAVVFWTVMFARLALSQAGLTKWLPDDNGEFFGSAFFVVYLFWLCRAQVTILRSFGWNRSWENYGRTVVVCAAPWVGYYVLPLEPAFRPADFDRSTANYWEYARTLLTSNEDSKYTPPPYNSAHVQFEQPRLLDQAAARIAPQRRGITDIYTIGIAGSSSEDVFIKELRGAVAAMSSILPLEGRDVSLINHPSTVGDVPVATWQNFATAVRAVGRVMDKEEDVLLLVMTSHGSSSGIHLALPGLTNTGLAPGHVARVLDQEGIKNRIVIVSACYSGVFLDPLINDNTVVLTAADDKNPSFGCANEREWTYFGDAFFNQGVRPGKDLREAFEDAKRLILSWEARDSLPASNPQGHFGEALMQKLAPLQASKSAAAPPSSNVR